LKRILTGFCSAEAIAAAQEQGIMRPNVWGHRDQHVIADFILSGEQYTDV
jgi:hypothetical protein